VEKFEREYVRRVGHSQRARGVSQRRLRLFDGRNATEPSTEPPAANAAPAVLVDSNSLAEAWERTCEAAGSGSGKASSYSLKRIESSDEVVRRVGWAPPPKYAGKDPPRFLSLFLRLVQVIPGWGSMMGGRILPLPPDRRLSGAATTTLAMESKRNNSQQRLKEHQRNACVGLIT